VRLFDEGKFAVAAGEGEGGAKEQPRAQGKVTQKGELRNTTSNVRMTMIPGCHLRFPITNIWNRVYEEARMGWRKRVRLRLCWRVRWSAERGLLVLIVVEGDEGRKRRSSL